MHTYNVCILQSTALKRVTFLIFHENWVVIYGYLYTFSSTHTSTTVLRVLCTINCAYGLWPINQHQRTKTVSGLASYVNKTKVFDPCFSTLHSCKDYADKS